MKSNWSIQKLTEISNPKQWGNLPMSSLLPSGYTVYGANGVIGFYTEYNHEKSVIAITCRGATCGNVLITKPKSYITSNAMVLDDVDESKYNLKFLLYALRKRGFKDVISGSAQPQITRQGLSNIQIPLPPLTDQLRIATVLTRAETLIAKRKESIRLLDDYLKSSFLEMFGDPVRNEKGWEINKLETMIIDIQAGSSYGGKMKDLLENDELGVLKVSAVTWGVFDPKEFKAIKKNLITKKVIHPRKGDLLFSRANTRELVGATCIVDDDYFNLFLPDKIWNIVLDEKYLLKTYLHFLLKNPTFKSSLTDDATGTSGSMLNISMEKLRNLKCPIPPLPLQNQFAAIVEKVETLKTKYAISLRELENLYGSLSQRAFKGELDLSHIRYDCDI